MGSESATKSLLLRKEEDDEAPLLLRFSSRGSELQRPKGKNYEFWVWLQQELFEQFRIAGPMILVNCLLFLLRVIPLMFVGHLGELAFSSSQIALAIAAATGVNVMIGLASGLETLCGQANGAKEYKLTGIFLQKAVFVLVLICFPISFLWWNIAPILMFMGQDPDISLGAQEFSRFLIPSLFAYAFLQPLVSFLQTQGAVNAMMVFSGLTLVIHIPLCYLLVYHIEGGLRGAAVALGISLWINVLLLAAYVMFSPTCKKTWTGFSSAAFEDIYSFLKIAVPSTIMICLENWCFEFFILMSGLLPNPELEASALAVCLNTVSLIYMVPFGLSAAVSTRVSNNLGAGLPYSAKASVKMAISLTLVIGCTLCILLISLRHAFPYLFTSDLDVVSYVSGMVPLLAVEALLDSCQATLSGVARGCGWQHLAAYSNLCAFYCIGIPVGLLMTFHFNYHGYGLWIGIICGLFTQVCLLSSITCSLDWQKLSDTAAELVHGAKDHYDALPEVDVLRRIGETTSEAVDGAEKDFAIGIVLIEDGVYIAAVVGVKKLEPCKLKRRLYADLPCFRSL
ncbi:hypothetical protein R1flu_022207 [Riccia fluitans]|uniref:Protein DETOXIFICATION n=1 Tax=Riccia fluitans TaxID=41844 RepID=A0ABD1ZUM0_9MARC